MTGESTRLTNGAVAIALPDAADDLHAVVRAERTELKRTLGELETAVRHTMDVRARLLEHPLVTVGAACAAGVALGVLSNRVPRRGDASDRRPSGSIPEQRATGPMAGATAPFAAMAATVTTLVAQRLADVAEETLRRVLAPRSS